jgi:hypothetical protein
MVEDIGVSEALIMEGAFAEVDGVLILTLDGRPHLDQLLSVLALGKPVFMDKPVAASLRDVIKVYQLAADAGVPLFSASALRWHPETLRVLHAVQGTPLGAISVGPAHALAHHPDLFFYGIHPAEVLFTVMGSRCVSVVAQKGRYGTLVIGTWPEGRLGTLHAIQDGAHSYKVIAMGRDVVAEGAGGIDYTPLVRQLVAFFQSGTPPVSAAETIEIYAFLEAANESVRRGGKRVEIAKMINQVTK